MVDEEQEKASYYVEAWFSESVWYGEVGIPWNGARENGIRLDMEKMDLMLCYIFIHVVHSCDGSPSTPFNLKRGLRQGDPLSPFLFIMVALVLNALLLRAKDIGIIQGVKVRRNKVDISHLQFTDDTLIFSLACVIIFRIFEDFLIVSLFCLDLA